MTLDEAIIHAEEVANANERLCETVHPAMQLSDYGKCAEQHRQLAEWLRDYKRMKEQEPCYDAISRERVAYILGYHADDEGGVLKAYQKIKELPSVQPMRKRGKWGCKYGCRTCSECGYCGMVTDDGGEWIPEYFCPNCGCQMEEGE